MKAKELKDYLNSLEEKDLQREVVLNVTEDHLESLERFSLSEDTYTESVVILSAHFGCYDK